MALMCRAEAESEAVRAGGAALALSGASREARYIELMRTMQFGTCLAAPRSHVHYACYATKYLTLIIHVFDAVFIIT